MIWHSIASFLAMFALDFIWAIYTQWVVANRHWMASFAAAGVLLCNALVTLLYVDNPWMLVPSAVGAFVGTACALKWHRAP